MTQTLHVHLEEYGPGRRTQKHGHVNEAAFYILDGKGYEIHDGVRYDWSAGDVAIVHMNCVHQHFNADPVKPARALVLKPKPMVLFMNLMFQQTRHPAAEGSHARGRGLRSAAFRENLQPLKPGTDHGFRSLCPNAENVVCPRLNRSLRKGVAYGLG